MLRASQRRAGCCLLCVRRSNGVVQAPRVLPGRVHACMKPMFDFVYALHYIPINFLIKTLFNAGPYRPGSQELSSEAASERFLLLCMFLR